MVMMVIRAMVMIATTYTNSKLGRTNSRPVYALSLEADITQGKTAQGRTEFVEWKTRIE
jgi:hypothetical protein